MGRWCYFGVATLVALILPTLNTATEFLTAPYYQHREPGMNQDSYDDQNENASSKLYNYLLMQVPYKACLRKSPLLELTFSNSQLTDPTMSNDQLRVLSRYLARILVQPWPDNGLPLLYIEDNESDPDDYPTSPLSSEGQNNEPGATVDMEDRLVNGEAKNEDALTMNKNKRNRFYRKYPWKRQNARQTYDADNRYLCQPSKDDVFRLLVALHDSKGGNRGRPIHFCNRKRPAHMIFTNIRFLGK